MDEQPRNVKDLLVEVKDASEIMVDLAYAALYFDEEELAEEVDRLETADERPSPPPPDQAMLAARSPEDAEGMGGVLRIARAIEQHRRRRGRHRAGGGPRELGIPEALRHDLRHADEMSARIQVREARRPRRSLGDLSLPRETGMWVVAIRRGEEWGFDPGADTIDSTTRTCCSTRARRRA